MRLQHHRHVNARNRIRRILSRWIPSPTATAAAIAVVVALGASAASADRVWNLKPTRGFIDDTMAFSPDGARFAFIHTDAAKFLDIILLDTSSFKEEIKIKVVDPRRVPKRLAFSPDGARLLLLWADGYTGAQAAMLFDAGSGKLLKETGKAQSARIASYGGQQVVSLTDVKTDKRGAETVTVTLYRSKDFKRFKGAKVNVNPDRTLKRPNLRLLYWEPAHLALVGMKRGKYDKKKDIRLPDKAVRYDVFTRKESWNQAPQKLMVWAKAVNMRANHPNQYRFLQVSDDLKTLHHVNRDNDLGAVQTPVKWSLYEPKSLRQHETWDGQTLYFSMTIDPVNPAAVARKKADEERADLYLLEGASATPLGQVLTDKRRFSWTIGPRHFAYLRKLKGFGRGGKAIELHTKGH